MKKTTAFMLSLLLIAIALSGCFGGDVSGVKRIIGDSEIYGGGEIRMAMEKVITLFDKEFDGCTLLELEYSEAISGKSGPEWAQQYGADEAIVLVSSFYVDSTGGDGSLEPDSTYRNYQWILTRTKGFGWKLRTWGYG